VNRSNENWVSSLRANSVSFLESMAQAVGTMAPSAGIAILVPMVFAQSGNATWLVFLAILLAYLLLAGVFRIFATRSASAGGLGHFAELAFGRWGGVLVSWLYILTLIFTLTCPLVSAVYYVGVLIHDYNGLAPAGWWNMAILFAMVAAAVVIVYFGIRFSSNFMLVVECLSLGGIGFLAFDAFFREPHWIDAAQLRNLDFKGANYSLAFATAFFCLTGFETITALGAETKRAKQTIPRAILCCLVPIGLLYVVLSYVLVVVFHRSPTGLGESLAPFEYISARLGLHWMGLAVSIGVVVSGFASVPACLNTAARVLYDLAKKGDFWPSFGKVEPRHGSPFLAILLMAILSVAGPLFLFRAGSSLSETIGYLTQLSSLTFIATYALSALMAPIFLRRIRALNAPDLAVSLAALLIMGALGLFNLYPVPPRPWNFLPYVAAGTVLLGVGATVAYRMRNPPGPGDQAKPALELALLAKLEKTGSSDPGSVP